MPRAIKRLLYLMAENILVPARQKNPRNNKIQKWKAENSSVRKEKEIGRKKLRTLPP
jgi:hypothetical protein